MGIATFNMKKQFQEIVCAIIKSLNSGEGPSFWNL